MHSIFDEKVFKNAHHYPDDELFFECFARFSPMGRKKLRKR
jgi:hypothetical protein